MNEPIDLDLTLDPALPRNLRGTERHLNCPSVALVQLLTVNGLPLRKLAFRGVIIENGNIVVSIPREFGHDDALHIVPRARVCKAVPGPVIKNYLEQIHAPTQTQQAGDR